MMLMHLEGTPLLVRPIAVRRRGRLLLVAFQSHASAHALDRSAPAHSRTWSLQRPLPHPSLVGTAAGVSGSSSSSKSGRPCGRCCALSFGTGPLFNQWLALFSPPSVTTAPSFTGGTRRFPFHPTCATGRPCKRSPIPLGNPGITTTTPRHPRRSL